MTLENTALLLDGQRMEDLTESWTNTAVELVPSQLRDEDDSPISNELDCDRFVTLFRSFRLPRQIDTKQEPHRYVPYRWGSFVATGRSNLVESYQ